MFLLRKDAHNDPNYPTVESPRENKLPKLRRFQSNDDDDDSDFGKIYDFPEFSSRASNLKINKWLKRENDSRHLEDSYEDEIYDEGSYDGPQNHEMYFNSSLPNGDLNRSNRNTSVSPPKIMNQNSKRYAVDNDPYSSAFKSQIRHNNAPVPRPHNQKASVNTQTTGQQSEQRQQAHKKTEYEIQEFTISFLEETSNYKTLDPRAYARNVKEFYDSAPVTQPQSEARVFVNNLNYDIPNDMKVGPERYYYGLRENSLLNNSLQENKPTPVADYGSGRYKHTFHDEPNKSNNRQPPQPTYYSNNQTANGRQHLTIQTETPTSSQKTKPVLKTQSTRISFNEHTPEKPQNSSPKISNNPKPVDSPQPPPVPQDAPKIDQSNEQPIKLQKKKNESNPKPYVSTGTLKNNVVETIELTNALTEAQISDGKFFTAKNTNISKKQPRMELNSETRQVRFSKDDKHIPNTSGTRQTPSPFTIDRILDEAFENFSGGPNDTFTDMAKQKLREYQKVKRNSFTKTS